MSRMETYPASISLGEESAQMWSLNKRLEAYLSRVKALEEENELLRAEIHHLQSTRSEKSLIRKYHDEIMKLRDALDDGHREIVQVETDRDSIYQEIEYVKELCHQEKQAQEDVKKEFSESKKLLEEEKRAQIWLKERLVQLEEEMEDILKAHEEDKALMEEEISSYSQRLENFKVAPANFQPVNVEDYAHRLSQIWQGAVEEYKSEVSALETNLSQAKENLKKVLEENKQSQLQLQNLDRDLQSLKNRKEMLEKLLGQQWLEQQEEEGRLQLEIETLEKEKQDLRLQITQVLEDRQQLMHLKMSLSLEVATYRSLLEAESTRLYAPSTDYKVSSSFSDSMLEQNTFRKSRHENTKTLVSKDHRLNGNKKQSAETSSANRYLIVKSTSFSNRTSPVTKEFQKVSSVLQSQGLNYTKASSAKAATTLPPVESNLGRHLHNGDVIKKSKVEIISHSYSQDSSKMASKETMRKDTDIHPVLNGNDYDITDAGLNETGHMVYAKGKLLPPPEKETVSAQVECSLKPTRKHVQFIANFGLEEQHHFLVDENKTLDFKKPQKEKTDFEIQQASEDFGHTDEEYIIEKQEVIGQLLSSQRVYGKKEELVEPLDYQNMKTSSEVNNEEFRKVLDLSKPNTQDIDEPNVLSSDNVSEQGIEYSLSQELDFDTQVLLNNASVDNVSQDKADINQGIDEEKESLQLNGGLELSHTEETSNYAEAVDLQEEKVTMDQKFQVLSSQREDSNQLFHNGQNFTKDSHDEHKSEMKEYHEKTEKDTTELRQDTNIQENYDNKLDQQSSRQDEDILDEPHSLDVKSEIDQCSDSKLGNTQFDQESLDVVESSDVSESRGHPSNEMDLKTESKEEETEGNTEENITNVEQNIHDIEKSGILIVREVYQSNKKVVEDLKEIQLQSQEEKNDFELSDLQQSSQSSDDQQRIETVKVPEEIAHEFSNSNPEESEDQKNKDIFDQVDNVQKEVSQLSKDMLESPQSGLEDLKSVDLSYTEQEGQQIGKDHIENKQIVHTMDIEEGEGDSSLDIHPDSEQKELHDHFQEKSVIPNEEGEDIQKFEKEIEQSKGEGQTVQSTPEHGIQSSVGEELNIGVPSLENDLIEKEEEDIKTNKDELESSELKADEEDKEDLSEENYDVFTVAEYTKSVRTEMISQYVHEECKSYEEDNDTEKEGPIPVEDSYILEHGAEKEQEQFVSMEEEYKEHKENEEDNNTEKEVPTPVEEDSCILEHGAEKEQEQVVCTEEEYKEHKENEEDNNTEKEGPTPVEEEDSCIPEHGAEKEQESVVSMEEKYKDHKVNEEDKQLVQKESDVQLNIPKEDGSLLKQKTELIVEGHLEVSTDMEWDIAKLDNVHQDSDVNEGQPSDKETSFPHGSEDIIHSDGGKDHEESSKLVLTTEGHNVSKEGETEQFIEKDYEIVEEAQANTTHGSQLLDTKPNVNLDEVAENEPEEKSSFHQEVEGQQSQHQEVEERQDSHHQEVAELPERFHQEAEEGQESHDQEVEGQESYHQEVEEGLEGNYQKVEEVKEDYHQEVEEGLEGNYQKVEEVKEDYHQEVEELQEVYHQKVEKGQEGYHQEAEERQEGYHQEVEDKVGYDISTVNKNVASEEDKERNQSLQKDSDEEQHMEFSLNIIPNNLRFTSNYDAETQPEPQGQSSDEGTETQGDEIHVCEDKFENYEQNNDDFISEVKKVEEVRIFEEEIICQQSTFHLEHACDNLLLENSKSHVVFAENPTEKYDFDEPTEKHLTERDDMEAASNPDNDNSKSEDSMDSQDISIYSQKSEEFEISKDYQLEQTLPDTTPLPNLDDEFEDLADDEIILASEQSSVVTKSQIPEDGGEVEEVLDSSLESQSSQILPEISEQSNLMKHDEKESDSNEQQKESPSDLLETEHPEHFIDPKLDTEDYSVALDTREVTESQSLVDGGRAEELLERSLELHSSPILPEESEQSNLIQHDDKDPDYNEQQEESPKDLVSEHPEPELDSNEQQKESPLDLLETEHPEHFVDPKLDTEDYSVALDTREVTESQSLVDGGKAEELIESSSELYSSPIHTEESEQSNLIQHDDKDLDYNEQQEESAKGFVSVQPEYFVDPKLDTEDSTATLDTREVAESLSPPDGGETDDVLDSSSESQSSPKLDTEDSSAAPDTKENTELETPADGEAEVVLESSLELQSSPKLPEESEQSNLIHHEDKDSDYNEHQEESDLLSEQPEPKLDTEDSSASLDTREVTESQSLADGGEAEELIESSLESYSSPMLPGESEQSTLIKCDVKDPDYNEQQEESPKDLVSVQPEYFVDPKLDTEDSTATLDTREVAESLSSPDGGETDDVLDSSLESQSSQILSEESEQSHLIKHDDKYSDNNEQQEENPIDLVSEHLEHSVDPNLDTDDSSATLDSREVTESQIPADGDETKEVLDSSLESQTSQILQEVSEQSNVIKYDDKDSNDQQDKSPKELLESKHAEHCADPKLNTEDSPATLDTTEVTESQSPADGGETEQVLDSSLESQSSLMLAEESDQSNLIKHDDKVPEYNEQQEESPKDFVSEVPEQFVDPKLYTEVSSATLVTKEPAAEPAENPVDSKKDDEKSEQSTTQEEVAIFSPEVDELKASKDTQLEKTQFESSPPEDQVQLSLEELGNESVDDDHNEEPKETRIFLTEDTDSENLITDPTECVPASERREETEKLNLIEHDDKDSDYNEQQEESLTDLVGEFPEHFVDPKLDTEVSSTTPVTEEPAAEPSEDPVDSKTDDENTKSEQSTTQEEVPIFSPEVDELEASKDTQLEKTQSESSPPEDQIQLSSEQLGSESVDDDHNEEPKERRVILIEENLLTDPTESVPASEHREETEQLNLIKHNDKDSDYDEHQEESPKDLVSEQPQHFVDSKLDTEDSSATLDTSAVTESQSPSDGGETEEVLDSSLELQSSQILPEVSDQSNLIKHDDPDYNEQQEESPSDVLMSAHPEHSVDPEMDTEDYSATLVTEEPAAEPSEDPVDSKKDDEKSKQSTTREEVAIFSPEVDEFEASNDTQLEKTQFESSPPEDQVQLSSEQLGSERVDDDHNEEPKERRVILTEDTDAENLLTDPTENVPTSEHSETELVPSPSHEDTTENEEYMLQEHFELVTQDLRLEQKEIVDTEDHETDICKKEDNEGEPLTEDLDEFNKDNIISSNVPNIPNVESEIQDGINLGTPQGDVKVDEKPSEEIWEKDDSVTSDESSPNVSTISYALEQEDSRAQNSEKSDVIDDTDNTSPKELEQKDPLLTPEPIQEGSLMEQIEPQTSSDEEKHILGKKRDSSCDSNKEHEDMSEFTREYSEDGKTVNRIYGHTIVQATLELDDHMFNGHSTSEIFISEANTVVRFDNDIVNSQSQDKIEDSVVEFTKSEGKSEGLFQSLLETSEHKEGRLDEASEMKNIMQAAVKYVDSDDEQSHYTKKLINPYLSERDLDDPSEITSSVMDEDPVNTKQDVNETNQGLNINKQEDSWSSDE